MLSSIRSSSTTYAIMRELGSGSFGQVFQVRDLRSNKIFACKIISKQLMHQYNAEDMIRQEIQLQSQVNHKNILKIIDSFEDNFTIFIILEYCGKGTLKLPTSSLGENQIFDVLHQVLSGLDHLHQHNIIHRDIKLENILIHDDGTLKICDFGWAIKADQATPVLCGTTEYMPPEVVSKNCQNYKLDLWSLGIVIYMLLHGKYPFKDDNQTNLIKQIINKEINISDNVSPELRSILLSLLAKDQMVRATISEIFLTKFMKRKMKEFNIFNKYENEEMKNKLKKMKSPPIKTVDNIGFITKSLSTGCHSLTLSQNTQQSGSTNPCSPLFSRQPIDQIFTFKDSDQYLNVPFPIKY